MTKLTTSSRPWEYSRADNAEAAAGAGPLRALLEVLQLPDLTELKDPHVPVPPRPGQVPGETRVPGFFCSSDPNATDGWFTAPVSYRATTGGSTGGEDGPFAIGRRIGLREVEAADGTSFTSGFSERLVGDHQPNHPAPSNYQIIPGSLAGDACPATDDPAPGAAMPAHPGVGPITAIRFTIMPSR